MNNRNELYKEIEYTLRYRLKNTLIVMGDFSQDDTVKIASEVERKGFETLFVNVKEGHVWQCFRDISKIEKELVLFSDMEEYSQYAKEYILKLEKYYVTRKTGMSIIWVGQNNAIYDLLSNICSKQGIPFTLYTESRNLEKINWKQEVALTCEKRRMKIAIVGRMGKYYSGGRYHAWMWAKSLAYTGNEVYFITNEEPIYTRDTINVEGDGNLHIIEETNFETDIEGIKELDYVLMIPHRTMEKSFFYQVRNLSLKTNSKLALLNFESPNWMNSYLKDTIDAALWDQWLYSCENGCMIISTDNESTKFAKKYYTINPKNTVFRNCYLAINTFEADEVELVEKENRVLAFIRFGDKHKGSYDILDVIDSTMKGYTFVFVIGANVNKVLYDEYIAKLDELKEKCGIEYEIKNKISDKEKYEELSRAKYLLFPSYFEGYGIPPVESMYFNVKCLAYDLPVIREVCKDGVVFCEYGNPKDMRHKLSQLIQEDKTALDLRNKIYEVANFESGARCLHEIFLQGLDIEWRDANAHYMLEE